MRRTRFVDTLSPGDLLGVGFTFVEKAEDIRYSSGFKYSAAKFKCPYCEDVRPYVVSNIKTKQTRSCGCWKDGKKLQKLTSKNRSLHKVWYGMHHRCYNPKAQHYKYYGGSGVTVCDRWHEPGGFERFELDMAPKYQPGLHLDKDIRFPGNKEYSRLTCQWVTHWENAQTKRNTVFCFYLGEYVRLEKVAQLLGVDYRTCARNWSQRGVPKKYRHLVKLEEKNVI